MFCFKIKPQNSIPDVIIWMLSGNERTAYHRIPANELIYSTNEDYKGELCGKVQTIVLKVWTVNLNVIVNLTLKLDFHFEVAWKRRGRKVEKRFASRSNTSQVVVRLRKRRERLAPNAHWRNSKRSHINFCRNRIFIIIFQFWSIKFQKLHLNWSMKTIRSNGQVRSGATMACPDHLFLIWAEKLVK